MLDDDAQRSSESASAVDLHVAAMIGRSAKAFLSRRSRTAARRKPREVRIDDSQARRYITIAGLETSPCVSPCFGANLRACDGVRCAVADRTSTAHGSRRNSRLGLQYS